MNINELERLTGITKQNIRFYEKKGLIHPIRNSANNYREYSDNDLTRLKIIKLLRKLDLSLEDIGKILSEESSLHTSLQQHLHQLENRQKELNGCIDICKSLLHTELESLNADKASAGHFWSPSRFSLIFGGCFPDSAKLPESAFLSYGAVISFDMTAPYN